MRYKLYEQKKENFLKIKKTVHSPRTVLSPASADVTLTEEKE
mgnify:CR=1 FL=1